MTECKGFIGSKRATAAICVQIAVPTEHSVTRSLDAVFASHWMALRVHSPPDNDTEKEVWCKAHNKAAQKLLRRDLQCEKTDRLRGHQLRNRSQEFLIAFSEEESKDLSGLFCWQLPGKVPAFVKFKCFLRLPFKCSCRDVARKYQLRQTFAVVALLLLHCHSITPP